MNGRFKFRAWDGKRLNYDVFSAGDNHILLISTQWPYPKKRFSGNQTPANRPLLSQEKSLKSFMVEQGEEERQMQE